MSDTRRPDFQQLQYRFAAHLRDPEHQPAPDGIEARRLKIYRELFFNNVHNYLSNAFPVLRRLYDDAAWRRLVRGYYARHVAQAPQFHQIPEEFLDYLRNEREAEADDPPFLLELAHYEWVELSLAIADVEPNWARIDAHGDLLAAPPVVSPLTVLLSYAWPVHRIGPEHVPRQPPEGPTFLAVTRDRDDRVRFMHLNALSARLLHRLQTHPDDSGRRHLDALVEQMDGAAPQAVIAGGADLLAQFHARDIVLGSRRAA